MKNKLIVIGEKNQSLHYDFRETCFGIVVKEDKLYCTQKNNEISLIGGGIEKGESHEECLRREFLEEAGCIIKSIKEFCTIDCFWKNRDNENMESLVNVYIVDIEEKRRRPTENGNKLMIIDLEKSIELLELPYHKRAILEYIKNKPIIKVE